MIPGEFSYQKPATIDEAVAALKAGGEDALLLAGGHSLVPMMKMRLAAPSTLIDLNGVEELRGVREDGGDMVIGAMTTQHDIINSEELAKACPLLREAALQIADPQVRYCGTIGGNAANGDPGNDMPAVLQALNAVYELRGADGARQVAARDYYHGPFDTARKDGEVLCAVRVPRAADNSGSAYEKQKRKIGDYATAAAAVVLSVKDGKIADAAVALTNVGDTPLMAAEAAEALNGSAGDDAAINAAAQKAAAICQPASDGRGPPEFRAYVAGVLVARAVRAAFSRAS